MRRCSSSGSGGCVVDPHWQPNTTVAAGWERVLAAHISPLSGPLELTERHVCVTINKDSGGCCVAGSGCFGCVRPAPSPGKPN